MLVRHLRLENLRCFSAAELSLYPGFNVFLGGNGAGKTSLLEAAYLLSHARSFRPGPREALARLGGGAVSVFAQVEQEPNGPMDRLGLARSGSRWQARINGATASGLEELLRRIRVVCFEPGSHALIVGPGEERRGFLDWTLFHVEPEFLSIWRHYHRALKQRNALLRDAGGSTSSLESWSAELARWGVPLNNLRRRFMEAWSAVLSESLARFLPELGEARLGYTQGWPEGRAFDEALRDGSGRDLERGHTSMGPHRADWAISFAHAPRREHLSRGQAKLTALACVLSQAQVLRHHLGGWPVICLDDLASELDSAHQAGVLDFLAGTDAQILLSGVGEPAGLSAMGANVTRFHVEQGGVKPLLLL